MSRGSGSDKATPNATGSYDPKYLGSVLAFADEQLDFTTELTSHGLLLVVKNKSAQTAKVIWDDGAFIDAKDASHSLRHESQAAAEERGQRVAAAALKSIERGDNSPSVREPVPESSTTSIIVSGTQLAEWLRPSDTKRPLIPTSAFVIDDESVETERAKVEQKIEDAKGSRFRFLVPISVGGERREYLFTFVYDGAEIVVEAP